MADEPQKPEVVAPIIIIKRKVGHGGHHGGAWKVAYADFVTAMMALFIVLWLLNSSEKVKKAISAYFNDPTGTGQQLGSNAAGSGETLSVADTDMNKLKEKLEAAMKQSPQIDKLKENVQMSVTGDGLRIEMLENDKGMFFQSGKPQPSAVGEEIIALMAAELGRLPNDLLIEGHTDAKPFGPKRDYTNWELSVDRANAARRLMEAAGLRPGQVTQVRGFADRQLRDGEHPEAASNRRVSVIVKYRNAEPAPEGEGQAKAGEHGEPAKEGTHGEAKPEAAHGEPAAKSAPEQKPTAEHGAKPAEAQGEAKPAAPKAETKATPKEPAHPAPAAKPEPATGKGVKDSAKAAPSKTGPAEPPSH